MKLPQKCYSSSQPCFLQTFLDTFLKHQVLKFTLKCQFSQYFDGDSNKNASIAVVMNRRLQIRVPSFLLKEAEGIMFLYPSDFQPGAQR